MLRPCFGSLEYYKSMFDDVLADAPEDPQSGLLIMDAFEASILDWLKYHKSCAQTYEQLHAQFLSNKPKV